MEQESLEELFLEDMGHFTIVHYIRVFFLTVGNLIHLIMTTQLVKLQAICAYTQDSFGRLYKNQFVILSQYFGQPIPHHTLGPVPVWLRLALWHKIKEMDPWPKGGTSKVVWTHIHACKRACMFCSVMLLVVMLCYIMFCYVWHVCMYGCMYANVM